MQLIAEMLPTVAMSKVIYDHLKLQHSLKWVCKESL